MSFISNLTKTAEHEKGGAILPNSSVRISDSFQSYIIPHKGWKIKEDYIISEDNNTVNAVVLIFQEPGKATDLPAQWGVQYINDLVNDVSKQIVQSSDRTATSKKLNISFINTIRMMPSEWVKKYQDDTDRYSETESDAETHRDRAQISSKQADIQLIADEIDNGASYLAVGFKYVVSANSIDTLDDFLIDLQQRLKQRVSGTIVALPNGNVEQEFAHLFDDPMKEAGMKTMFTSTEFAGFYNLVTQGIEDDNGVYVGEQTGDINNTAVIWDMTQFKHYAVMGIDNSFARIRDYSNNFIPDRFTDFSGSDLWLNSLILQLVREKQGRIFTLALDPINLSDWLQSVTSTIDLSKGTINPFEMFGHFGDEMAIYQANVEKWNIMARQLSSFQIKADNAVQQEPLANTDIDEFDEILQQFYIDNKMWRKNPEHNRNLLRIINVEHSAVPTLDEFVSYIKTQYNKNNNPETGDPRKADSDAKILSIFNRLLSTNSDIFNTHTSPQLDSLGTSRHTLLDYADLSKRKGNILLVQLLNSISAIASQMNEGDVLIIHGAQRITDMTQAYIKSILDELYVKKIRVVFSYNTAEQMLNNKDFNHLSSADWVLSGHLTADQVAKYNKLLGNQRQITSIVKQEIQAQSDARYYLRRGQDNIIFDANPTL